MNRIDKILFKNINNNKKFEILLTPPPNLTGDLHIGHVVELTIIDFISRYSFLFENINKFNIFGIDHASLYSEIVVKNLLKKQNINIFSKSELINYIKEFQYNSFKKFLFHLKKLNIFRLTPIIKTFNKIAIDRIYKSYKKLNNLKLLKKDVRSCNWDPILKTVIADIEVENIMVKQKLYDIRYDDNYIVSTTKPETLIDDVALAVKDKKYIKDKFALNPIRNEYIPVIIDYRVKEDFGTGVLKISPSKSKIDYEIATDHSLPLIPNYNNFNNYINFDINKLILSSKDIVSSIPINSRNNNRIDHILLKQIFLDLSNYSKELKLWCISRSNNFGIKIPYSNIDLNKTHIFDTWFSSSLWPLLALDTLKNKFQYDFKNIKFNLVVGKDLKLFWVEKMKALSICLLNKVIPSNILYHGLITDNKGIKISKSKNNSFNISKLIEKKEEVDKLRLSILLSNVLSDKFNIDISTLQNAKRFINKLINLDKIINIIIQQKDNNDIEYTQIGVWFKYRLIQIIFKLKEFNTDSFKEYINFINVYFSNVYIEICKFKLSNYELLSIWKIMLKFNYCIQPYISKKLFSKNFKEDILINELNIYSKFINDNNVKLTYKYIDEIITFLNKLLLSFNKLNIKLFKEYNSEFDKVNKFNKVDDIELLFFIYLNVKIIDNINDYICISIRNNSFFINKENLNFNKIREEINILNSLDNSYYKEIITIYENILK